MPVTMICPDLKCGRTVVAPDSARGKVVRCAHCQTLFMVPKHTTAPQEAKNQEPEPLEESHHEQS